MTITNPRARAADLARARLLALAARQLGAGWAHDERTGRLSQEGARARALVLRSYLASLAPFVTSCELEPELELERLDFWLSKRDRKPGQRPLSARQAAAAATELVAMLERLDERLSAVGRRLSAEQRQAVKLELSSRPTLDLRGPLS